MEKHWSPVSSILQVDETELTQNTQISPNKKHIETLATFLPDQILNIPADKSNYVEQFEGVLLLADISGFTQLFESYSRTGKESMQYLTDTFNAHIGSVIEAICFYGGDVLKFSGNGFLAMWKPDPNNCMSKVIHEVIVCALFIKSLIQMFTTEDNESLKITMAIACGDVTFAIIGDDWRRDYIVLGPATNNLKAAIRVGAPGDVVMAPDTWRHLDQENYDVSCGDDGNVKVWRCLYNSSEKTKEYDKKELEIHDLCQKHIEHRNILHSNRKADCSTSNKFITDRFIRSLLRKATRALLNKCIINDLRPYVFTLVREQADYKQPLKYLTETRNVTMQCISISPAILFVSKIVAIMDQAYRLICSISGKVQGIVSKASLFGEDASILVIYCSRSTKQDLESQNALKSAYRLHKAISELEGVKSVSVGITKGLVYAGVIGHPFRREYVVIGAAVNKAVGIARAYQHKVTCDYKTYQNSKLACCYFRLQPPVELKEVENVGHIFEYNENFDETAQHKTATTLTLGREGELDLINLVICNPQEAQGYRGLLIHGKAKTGKTKLLTTALENCSASGHTLAAVCLCGPCQRPYYCVSVLYKQLIDVKTKVDSKRASKTRPRHLWDLNEILQTDTLVNRNERIACTFSDLVRNGKGGFSVVFIDNVQYIDIQSMDVLESAIRLGCLRLICGGEFEVARWDIYWKMSMNDYIKLIELEPLNRRQISAFMCYLLDVQGVYKKTVSTVFKHSEGRPGWVQAYLLGKINHGDLKVRYVLNNEENSKRYAFPELKMPNLKHAERGDTNSAVPVVELRDKSVGDYVVTLADIAMALFDLLAQHEQLIVKTAAVLGEIFTRSLLVTLLKTSDDKTFSAAIKRLFEEGVFDCGMVYISNGQLSVDTMACCCYVDDNEVRYSKERRRVLPKYALCKLLHFKNKSLRTIVYDMLPLEERKEIHLRTTDVLETQDNLCQNCQRYNSDAVIKMMTFKDMMKWCNEENGSILKISSPGNIETSTDGKSCSQITEKQQCMVGDINVSKRKVWDPTTCFCLDILTKLYADLVHHSQRAGHLGKRIFFLIQYAVVLSTIGEYEETICYLNEANNVCKQTAKDANSTVSADCLKLYLGKIHMLSADANFKLQNIKAAKNHLAVSLRQYNMSRAIPKYTVMDKWLGRLWNVQKKSFKVRNISQSNLVMKSDFARYLNLLSNILSAEGYWELAKQFALRSLTLLYRSKTNVAIVCDMYYNALHIHNTCGDTNTCRRLERCVKSKVLRRWNGNTTVELYALSRLIFMLFQVNALTGNITDGIKIAYRAMHVNNIIQALSIQTQMLPVLATMLIMVRRIEDAVNVSQILRDIGRTYDGSALVGYHAFCVELNVETSFVLESVDKCEQFANNYFCKLPNKTSYTPIEKKLIVYLYCHYIRKSKWGHALKWKKFYKPEREELTSFISIYNKLKFAECCLLMLVKDTQLRKPFLTIQERIIEQLLAECELVSKKWKGCLPRTLHYKAYYCQIKERKSQARSYLRSALKEVQTSHNMLEECWLNLSKNCWEGGFHFGNDMKDIDWKLATNYNALEWSQIMYALPHNAY